MDGWRDEKERRRIDERTKRRPDNEIPLQPDLEPKRRRLLL